MTAISSLITKKAMATLATLLTVSTAAPIYSDTFPANTKYELCFTPGSNCTGLIVKEIDQAAQSIFVQAYSFTSKPIAKAITQAQSRGVEVNVILDKSQSKHNKYSAAKYFIHQSIPVWIDDEPAIAHNKVMIIDNNTVITGSFNFTRAAQEDNAENVLIIHDTALAKRYTTNFLSRKAVSKKMPGPRRQPSF